MNKSLMETITHNLFAVFIQILCFMCFIFPWNVIFTIIFAFLSHIILDDLSFITYHTPDPMKDDKFWLVWHYILYALLLFSIVIFIIPYWLSILFANIIDLWDWHILRPIQKRIKSKNPDSKWGDKYYMHQIVDWVRLKLFNWLPNRRYKKSGIVIEISIIIVFTILLSMLNVTLFFD